MITSMMLAVILQIDATGDSVERHVLAWAKECSRFPSLEIGWTASRELLSKDGDFVDAFDYSVAARFDYPHQLDVKTRYIPTGHEQDSTWNMMTNIDVRIDAWGNWTETNATGATRELGDVFILRDLVKARAYEAPVLLGMWINEHPDRFEVVKTDALGHVLFRVADLNLRATLEDANNPKRAWISRLESIDGNGALLSWSVFDEPVVISGASVRTGSIRTPVSIRRQTAPREGLPAYLEYARAVDPPARAPVPDAAAIGSSDGAQVVNSGDERATASARSFAIWWIGGVIAVLGIATGALLWTRRAA